MNDQQAARAISQARFWVFGETSSEAKYDPQAAYEALVKAVEDEGYVVLMDVEGKISLVQTSVRLGDDTGRSSEIPEDA